MGGDPVAGKGGDDLLVIVDHHVHQESGADHGARFHHIGMDRVSRIHIGAADLGIGAVSKTGIQS